MEKNKTKFLFDEFSEQKKIKKQLISPFHQFFISNYFLKGEREKAISSLVKEMSGGLILDLGCGCGENSFYAASVRRDLNIICIDISLNSLRKARDLHVDMKNITYVLCDADNLPFQIETFDAIMSIMTLHHLSNLQLLNHLYALLKKRKKILIIENVSNNPLIEYGRRFFTYMPEYVKRSLPEEHLLPDYKIPDILLIDADFLVNELKKSGFQIIKEERFLLYFFVFWYASKIIPSMIYLFPPPVLKTLYNFEIRLMKFNIFRNYGRVSICECIK